MSRLGRKSSEEMIRIHKECEEREERESMVSFAKELLALKDPELVADKLESWFQGELRDFECNGGFGG